MNRPALAALLTASGCRLGAGAAPATAAPAPASWADMTRDAK